MRRLLLTWQGQPRRGLGSVVQGAPSPLCKAEKPLLGGFSLPLRGTADSAG